MGYTGQTYPGMPGTPAASPPPPATGGMTPAQYNQRHAEITSQFPPGPEREAALNALSAEYTQSRMAAAAAPADPTQEGESGSRSKEMASETYDIGRNLLATATTTPTRVAPTVDTSTLQAGPPPTVSRDIKVGQGLNSIQAEDAQRLLMLALQEQAAGRGPSLAQTTADQGANAALRNALSLSRTARGGNIGAAMAGAQRAGGAATMQAAAEGVKGRIQEQMNAQQVLRELTGTMSTQDLERMKAQADVDRSVAIANLEAETQMDLKQLDVNAQAAIADLDAKLKQMGLDDDLRIKLIHEALNAMGGAAQTEAGIFGISEQSDDKTWSEQYVPAVLSGLSAAGAAYAGKK